MPADQSNILNVFDGVREKLDAIDWAETRPIQDASARQTQVDSIVDGTVSKLKESLGADGLQKLDNYVQEMKRGIVIYGVVPQQ